MENSIDETRAFKRALRRFEETIQTLGLAMNAISRVKAMPQLFEALTNYNAARFNQEPDPEQLRRIGELANVAYGEEKRGFPLLHAQATVTIWSIIETAVDDFSVDWILLHKDILLGKRLGKLTVPLHRFVALTEEERVRLVVEKLKQELGLEFSSGIGHFEPLLGFLGFGGGFDDDCRRYLVELGEVRNCIVHRGGMVDRKLMEACPWLEVMTNQQLNVSHGMFGNYSSATSKYLAEVICRIAEKQGYRIREKVSGSDIQTEDS